MNREKISKALKWMMFVIAICMGLFQIYNSIYRNMDPIKLQNMHLMFSLVLIFMGGIKKACDKGKSWLFIAIPSVMLVLSLIGTIYIQVNYDQMIMRVGRSTQLDLVIGAILIIVTLESTRETFGKAIPILSIIGIIYMFVGPYLGGIFYHGGFSVKRVIATLTTSFSGMYGTLLNTSATFIALFMILGGFMSKTGAGRFFVNLALSVGGRFRAGPGIAAIMASGLMGMINGSASAVVATTGIFTIPLMTDRGYEKEFSAAVCSVASTGGMIMPPVMGVGAFIMAELTGNTYGAIAFAAIIPAVLYYLLAGTVVVVRAKKMGLQPIAPDQLPKLGKTLKEGVLFLLPIVSIVYCLAVGYSTSKAALYAIGLLVLVYLIKKLVEDPKKFFTKEKLFPLVEGLADGAMSCIGVAVTMASVGILTNCIIATGLANRLVNLILNLGQNGQLFSLFITMLLTLLFGMGVPTTAAYIILAMMAAPSLVEIGLPLMPVHLFIFYFAAIANLTPPVAPATIIAGKMADANYVKACGHALKMSVSAFILPFIFVFQPAMLMQGSIWDIVYISGTAAIGLILFSFFAERYLVTKTTILEQIMLLLASILLIFPFSELISLVGILLGGFVVVRQLQTQKRVSTSA